MLLKSKGTVQKVMSVALIELVEMTATLYTVVSTLRQVVPEPVEGLRNRKLNHRNANLLDSPFDNPSINSSRLEQRL